MKIKSCFKNIFCNRATVFFGLLVLILVSLFVFRTGEPQNISLSDSEKTALNDITATYKTDSEIKTAEKRINEFENEMKTVKKDRSDYYLHIAIAQQYELIGRGELSAMNLHIAGKEGKTRSLPYLKLGELFTKAGLLDRAEQYFKIAIDLEPQIVQNHRALIGMYIEKFGYNSTKIQSLFGEARTETGDDVEILRMYAKWLVSDGQNVRAIDILRFILRENPTDKEEIENEILRLTQLINTQ